MAQQKNLPQTVEELKLMFEEVLRAYQQQLQNIVNVVADQYGNIDTNTHKIMLDLSVIALGQKSQASETLELIKGVSLLRQVA